MCESNRFRNGFAALCLKTFNLLLVRETKLSIAFGWDCICVVCFRASECQQPLGMANGDITVDQITASSEYHAITHAFNYGRLFYKKHSGAWMVGNNDASPWLQVDLGRENVKVTRVATQGRASYPQWVTTYKLQHSNDAVNLQYYREQGQTIDKVKCILRITKN